MSFLLFFLCELVFLFLTSRLIISSLFFLFLKIGRSKKVSMFLISILFFPGVVVHEFAHFLTAGVLGVPVGKIEFFPELDPDGLKLGSVQIAKTDFLRRFLIGVAPILLGVAIVVILVSSSLQQLNLGALFSWPEVFYYVSVMYGVFVISNTMFSSKKDLEGVLGIIAIIVIVGTGILVTNSHLITSFVTFLDSPAASSISQKMIFLFLPSCVFNLFFTGIFFFVRRRH